MGGISLVRAFNPLADCAFIFGKLNDKLTVGQHSSGVSDRDCDPVDCGQLFERCQDVSGGEGTGIGSHAN